MRSRVSEIRVGHMYVIFGKTDRNMEAALVSENFPYGGTDREIEPLRPLPARRAQALTLHYTTNGTHLSSEK